MQACLRRVFDDARVEVIVREYVGRAGVISRLRGARAVLQQGGRSRTAQLLIAPIVGELRQILYDRDQPELALAIDASTVTLADVQQWLAHV